MTIPAAGPGRTRRALVIRGGWAGHQPVETTNLFLDFLWDNGFAVEIHELDVDLGPIPYAHPELMAQVDLILQCVSMGSISPAQIAGLREAVAAGTGLAGWHGGMLDAFRNSFEYDQLVGGLFAAHPGSGPDVLGGAVQKPHRYTIVDHEHPITAGLADFELTTEQYWVLSDDYCDVLATTTQPSGPWSEWTRPVTSPAVWTRRWGLGRVFVATPGHDPAVLADPTVRTIVERGLLWAAR